MIAEEMGHSNKSIAEGIYVHINTSQHRVAAMTLVELYGLGSYKLSYKIPIDSITLEALDCFTDRL